ncbi:MAG: sel1 repeat family protein [Treponema sp.]|nr:sel1 repeat family protein [Candidatus Treponema caballi]
MENIYREGVMGKTYLHKWYLYISVIVLLIGCLCMCKSNEQDEKIALNGVYYLSEVEISSFIERSQNEDVSACIKLAKYYSMYLDKPEEALKYYKIGADVGNDICQYSYGFLLWELKGDSMKEEAVQYLKSAALNGNEYAIEYLEEKGIAVTGE